MPIQPVILKKKSTLQHLKLGKLKFGIRKIGCSMRWTRFCSWDIFRNSESMNPRFFFTKNVLFSLRRAAKCLVKINSFSNIFGCSRKILPCFKTTKETPRVKVPMGASIFPKEIIRTSRRFAERVYTNIIYWNELNKGGHFAAFEKPQLFVEEVQNCFREIS